MNENNKQLPLAERLRYEDAGAMIFAEGHLTADLADLHEALARIRGWGYLTGAGGLGLPEEAAVEYQDRFGRYLVAAYNLCRVVGLTEEEIAALVSAPQEVVRAMLARREA